MTGPLLRFSDLSPSERMLVEQDIARGLASGHIPPTSASYLSTLHSWGIMCPHPTSSRTYEGMYWSDGVVPFEECQWYDCEVCGCIVINR